VLTFTIVARCPRTSAFGIATCTTGMAVGSAVPHVEAGVGAVATQATTNVVHGDNCLRLLRMGFEPQMAIKSTLVLDPHPEHRQILVVDSQDRTASHTGSENEYWKGALEGKGYVVAGNGVASLKVAEAVVEMFKNLVSEALPERLVRAIDAGERAGGCTKPDHTAALLVVGMENAFKIFLRPVLDLRVDYSTEPTKDLLELYGQYKTWISERRKDPKQIRGY